MILYEAILFKNIIDNHSFSQPRNIHVKVIRTYPFVIFGWIFWYFIPESINLLIAFVKGETYNIEEIV